WVLGLIAGPAGAMQPQDPQPSGAAQDPATGQDPKAPGSEVLTDPRAGQLLGRLIRLIRVLQVEGNQLQPMTEEAAGTILRGLLTRAGQPLELRKVSTDIANLWYERRLAVRAFARPEGEQVDFFLIIENEVQVYERVEFQGLKEFTRSEVDSLLGLYPDRQVTNTEARAMSNVLIAHYRRAGFAFCSIELIERDPLEGESSGDRPRKIVTFRIDEGPEVTVGKVRFFGNQSFPSQPALGLFGSGDYLLREAKIQSAPAGLLTSGDAYSREVLEEDLDRLSLFYRSRGFLDAVVNIADVRFHVGRSVVDLDFQVVEGPRYVIRKLVIEHIDEQGQVVVGGDSYYTPAEVEEVLKSKGGEFYDHRQIRQDIEAIETFYGERGHPSVTYPGMRRVPGAFRIDWPKETYDADAGVELTFQIQEGTPKTLRDVVIRGNESTRDKVIRRRIRAMPGERIDMAKVELSLAYLRRTRFFQDQFTLSGPRFELLPVAARTDVLDLAIDVQEGETGEFRWGIGVSTGAGAQATLQFNKRNFDLWNPPSSWNPLTMFDEIIDNRAFHGGGQQLDLLVAPGTEVSQFQIGWTEPDFFGDYFNPVELRVNGHRRIRRYSRDGYTTDTLGAEVGLSRKFGDALSAGISVRQESVEVENPAPDATILVYDAEGTTELRGIRLQSFYRDLDDFWRPSEGVSLRSSYEVLGGIFGGEEDMWKATLGGDVYFPLGENEFGHRTILSFANYFGVAQAYGDTDDVFLTERFYLGGRNLRGFDFRGAGPSQFGRPLGGQARYYSSLEVELPMVATRIGQDLRDRELIRGVVFLDFGLLGLELNDPTFRQPRLSYGFGVRIEVPVLDIPIALDLAWPILYEESDDRRQLYFSISR
ncbi:MAG: BamA/TamA family outer membrane protein, partial [Planctomycetota bacterium]|nr:BamA/TamA family outer membrane protein [Planctomycetota bacterium]